MTNRLELNWKLDGLVDEQRYYRSESPIDKNNLPAPRLVFDNQARSYTDTDIEIGKKYYIALSSVRNSIEKLSEQVSVEIAAKIILSGFGVEDVVQSGQSKTSNLPVNSTNDLILILCGGTGVASVNSYTKLVFNSGQKSGYNLDIYYKQSQSDSSFTISSSGGESYFKAVVLKPSVQSKKIAIKSRSINYNAYYPIEPAISQYIAFPTVSSAGLFQMNVKVWNQSNANYDITDKSFTEMQNKLDNNRLISFCCDVNAFKSLSVIVPGADVSVFTRANMATMLFDLVDI